jgi:hypothetical protein
MRILKGRFRTLGPSLIEVISGTCRQEIILPDSDRRQILSLPYFEILTLRRINVGVRRAEDHTVSLAVWLH